MLNKKLQSSIDYIISKITDIKEGESDPLLEGCEIYIFFKELKVIEENYKELMRYEFSKYSKEELMHYSIEKKEGKRVYKFDHIPEWVAKKNELKSIEDIAKRAMSSEFENSYSEFIDEDTGEVIEKPTIVPAKVSYSKESITFK